jgi:hypothetical protein
MRLHHICLALTILIAGTCLADSFPVSGAFGFRRLSGSIDINPTTGAISNWNVVMPSQLNTLAFTFTPSDSTATFVPNGGPSGQSSDLIFDGSTLTSPGAPLLNFFLFIPSASLVGFTATRYGGGNYLSPVNPSGSQYYFGVGGVTIGSVAIAPEPSTAFLLATGILGLAAFRKSRRS